MPIKKAFFITALLFVCFLFAHIHGAAEDQAYVKDIEKWRFDRATRLKSNDGWLSLVGLYWLSEGENKFGSDPDHPVILPKKKSPATAGTFVVKKGNVRLKSAPGAAIQTEGKPVTEMVLESDEQGKPTVLTLGSLVFHVIKRGDKLGVRIKDRESDALKHFAGLEYYPISEKYKVTARFEPYNPPKKVPILNIVGITTQENSPGAIVFDLEGKTYRLDPIVEQGSDELFIMFADKTSGIDTYGAGRYLYTKLPEDGKVTLDFNKAYNPPCAFTAFATCPLPPPQNRLPVAIQAGEKDYKSPAGAH